MAHPSGSSSRSRSQDVPVRLDRPLQVLGPVAAGADQKDVRAVADGLCPLRGVCLAGVDGERLVEEGERALQVLRAVLPQPVAVGDGQVVHRVGPPLRLGVARPDLQNLLDQTNRPLEVLGRVPVRPRAKRRGEVERRCGPHFGRGVSRSHVERGFIERDGLFHVRGAVAPHAVKVGVRQIVGGRCPFQGSRLARAHLPQSFIKRDGGVDGLRPRGSPALHERGGQGVRSRGPLGGMLVPPPSADLDVETVREGRVAPRVRGVRHQGISCVSGRRRARADRSGPPAQARGAGPRHRLGRPERRERPGVRTAESRRTHGSRASRATRGAGPRHVAAKAHARRSALRTARTASSTSGAFAQGARSRTSTGLPSLICARMLVDDPFSLIRRLK